MSQYQQGEKIYHLNERKVELEKKIAGYDKYRSVNTSSPLGVEISVVSATYAYVSTSSMYDEIAEIERKIASVQATAPDAADYCEFEAKRKMPMTNPPLEKFLWSVKPEIFASYKICSRAAPLSTSAR